MANNRIVGEQIADNTLSISKLKTDIAGAGLAAGGNGTAIAVGAGTGIVVNANDVAVSTKLAALNSATWANNKAFLLSGASTVSIVDFGAANGFATLDGTGKVPVSQLPAAVVGALNYQSTWNANTNSPALASGVGTKGYYYVVSVTGTTTLDGISDWDIGDWVVYNGTAWEKIDNTDSVTSVFGRTGAVAAQSGDYSAFYQPLDSTLTSLAAYNTNGLLTQTSADTFTGRTLTGTASRISISNGDGISGNPTVDIHTSYLGQTSITTLGTITTGTWNGTDIAFANFVAAPSAGYVGATGAGDYSHRTISDTRTDLSINNVENTALSTWAGSTNITTLGTIATGTWNGSAIGPTYGGTGQTTYATGDILYASGVNTLAKLAAGTDTHVLTLAGGVPTWAPVSGSGDMLTTNYDTALSVVGNPTNATAAPVEIIAGTDHYVLKRTGTALGFAQVATDSIADDAVTVAKIENIGTNTILANVTGGSASPTAASASAVTAILSAFVGDSGSGGTKGLVPAPSTGDASKYLKGDGTWSAVAGGTISLETYDVGDDILAADFAAIAQWIRYEVDHSDFTAAATSEAITLGDLEAGLMIHEVFVRPHTAYSGGTVSAAVVDVGTISNDDEFVISYDIFAAVLGDSQSPMNVTPRIYSFTDPTELIATVTTTGDDVVDLTAGKFYIYLRVSKLM